MNKMKTREVREGMEEKKVHDRRLMEESRGYVYPVFVTSKERPKRKESIKPDLIYEALLWLEAGRGV